MQYRGINRKGGRVKKENQKFFYSNWLIDEDTIIETLENDDQRNDESDQEEDQFDEKTDTLENVNTQWYKPEEVSNNSQDEEFLDLEDIELDIAEGKAGKAPNQEKDSLRQSGQSPEFKEDHQKDRKKEEVDQIVNYISKKNNPRNFKPLIEM